MKMLVAGIRIDGGTQPRAAIDEPLVAEYADALKAGAAFPPVVVFEDGTDFWLAEGFHRFHAHRHAKLDSIAVELHTGTKRDAILFSVGASSAHGLRRSNEDKRKAVLTLLNDAEWSQWSDNAIAKACRVSNHLVADIRQEVNVTVTSPSERKSVTYKDKHGNTTQMDTSGQKKAAKQRRGKEKPAASKPKPAAKPAAKPEPQPEPDGPAAPDITEIEALREANAELASNLAELMDENAAMVKVFDADDKLAADMAEIKRLNAQVRVLQSRVNGLMSEKNEAIRAAKSWQRKAQGKGNGSIRQAA